LFYSVLGMTNSAPATGRYTSLAAVDPARGATFMTRVEGISPEESARRVAAWAAAQQS